MNFPRKSLKLISLNIALSFVKIQIGGFSVSRYSFQFGYYLVIRVYCFWHSRILCSMVLIGSQIVIQCSKHLVGHAEFCCLLKSVLRWLPFIYHEATSSMAGCRWLVGDVGRVILLTFFGTSFRFFVICKASSDIAHVQNSWNPVDFPLKGLGPRVIWNICRYLRKPQWLLYSVQLCCFINYTMII